MEVVILGEQTSRISSLIKSLPVEPDVALFHFDSVLKDRELTPMALLTNSRGAMSRMRVSLGEVVKEEEEEEE